MNAAREGGVKGVPVAVIQGKWVIEGAQKADCLVSVRPRNFLPQSNSSLIFFLYRFSRNLPRTVSRRLSPQSRAPFVHLMRSNRSQHDPRFSFLPPNFVLYPIY